jgi:hypothetical protein
MEKKLKLCNGCEELKVIWKNHEGNKYCQYCWAKVKSGDPEHKSVIPKVSAKKQKQDAEYLKLRARFLTEKPMCEINVSGCTMNATDVHHTRGGEERSVYYLIQSTWLSSCRNCHHHIHMNPAEARTMGWLK